MQKHSASKREARSSVHVDLPPSSTHALPFRPVQPIVVEGYDKLIERLHKLTKVSHPYIVAETFSTEQPREFTIGTGQTATFGLRVATGDGATTYMTSSILAIIPPGDVAPVMLRIQLPVAPTLEVKPLVPAATK